ncbi:hypothetical protein M3Y99_00631100 [Aphelenchoides fujianensis]|nr:hypothetical protein M3Y99_00631100 [Aphelenchoides fujianensis]
MKALDDVEMFEASTSTSIPPVDEEEQEESPSRLLRFFYSVDSSVQRNTPRSFCTDDREQRLTTKRPRRSFGIAVQFLLLLLSSTLASGYTYSDAQAKKITYPSYLRVNRCYSCMSPMYQELFRDGELSQFFFEPKNFTSQCENPMDSEGIGLVPCRAICLTLTQEFTTGRKLTMRGCVNSLSRFGFHNQTIALFDQYDLCRDVRASDLFRFGTDTQPITVCSCLGDRCNGAALGGGARSSAFLTTTVGLLTLLTGFLLR